VGAVHSLLIHCRVPVAVVKDYLGAENRNNHKRNRPVFWKTLWGDLF
jgi:hypothetical protein